MALTFSFSFSIPSFAEEDSIAILSWNKVEVEPGGTAELILYGYNLPDSPVRLYVRYGIYKNFIVDSNSIKSSQIEGITVKKTVGEAYSIMDISAPRKQYTKLQNGELARFTVTIPEDTECGTYEINLDTVQDYNNTLGQIEGQNERVPAEQKTGYITVKKAENSIASSEYKVSLDSSSISSISPESTFEVPVVIQSDSDLAAMELNVSCTNAEITEIKDGKDYSDLNIVTGSDSVNCLLSTIDDSKSKGKLTFCGNTASAKDGLKVATLVLKAGNEGSVTVKIDSGKAVANGETGLDENGNIVDGTDVTIPEESLIVQIVPAYSVEVVENYSPGFAMVRCIPETNLGTSIPAYNGKAMFSRAYTDNNVVKTEYLYLIKSSELVNGAEQGTVTADLSKISLVNGESKDLSSELKGDLNGSKAVNIVDAQIAYDLSKGTGGKYNEITDTMTASSVDMLHWLMGDVNSDRSVTALDARAIMVYIHTQDWSKNLPA